MSLQLPALRPSGLPLRACAVVLLVLAASWPAVFAQDQERGAVERALDRVEKALQNEPGLAPETRGALRALVMALRAERAGGSEALPQVAAQPPEQTPLRTKAGGAKAVEESLSAKSATREEAPWERVVRRLAPYGDLRLRSESAVRLDNGPDRHRQRVRFRLGTNYQLTDEILLGVRMATGDLADPASPHQTMGNVFQKFSFSLDRAFLTYRPAWAPGAWVTAGKFNHPFNHYSVYSELVWDADVQPEGAVGGYTFSSLGALKSFSLTAGRYILLEQARGADAMASVFQASGHLRWAERVGTSFGLGYYHYSNVTPDGSKAMLSQNVGNATLDLDGDGKPDDYRSRFGIANPTAQLTYEGWTLPLTLSAEYILNTRSRVAEDQGWAVGLSLGKAQKRGDWRLYYQRQIVEQDAVFSRFSQDDFLFATDHRSHVFGVNKQVTDSIGLHLWGLVSARDKRPPGRTSDSYQNQWRLRLDLNARF